MRHLRANRMGLGLHSKRTRVLCVTLEIVLDAKFRQPLPSGVVLPQQAALALELVALCPLLVLPFALDLAPRNLLEAFVGTLERVRVDLVPRNHTAHELLAEHQVVVHCAGGDLGDIGRLELEECVALGLARVLAAGQTHFEHIAKL